MPEDVASVHRHFVDEVVVGKRLQLLDDLFSPDALVEQGSLEALRAQMEAQAAGLDLAVVYLHELVHGDWVVHHMDITITHTGDFMGNAGTGRTARLAEVEAARIVGGEIVEMWSVADRLSVIQQLGLRVPDATG